LVFHIALVIVVFSVIAFKQVNYVKRDVYEVSLVGAVQTARASTARKPEAAKPAPVEEKKVEEKKPDEMPAAPVDQKKPKPQEKKDAVPTTDPRRTSDARPDSSQAGTGEPAAPGPPGDAPAMGAVSIDGGNFPFSSYISRMRQKIATTWEVPAGTEGLQRSAVVYFRVHRDGSVSNVTVEKSSALQLFDRSCQRAVIEAAPLPPLPREFLDEFVSVHFSFVYQPTE